MLIGLTGGIGSGKSAMATVLREQGICVIDADQVARQVVEPGEPALLEITRHFGSDILNPDASLNRAALRNIIFSQPTEKSWLEELLHPAINQRIQEQLKQASGPYAVLESPLLLETDQHKLVDKIIVVDTEPAIQLERACLRDNNSREQIKRIIASQLPQAERRSRADWVIDNNGSKDDLKTASLALHQTLLRLSGTE